MFGRENLFLLLVFERDHILQCLRARMLFSSVFERENVFFFVFEREYVLKCLGERMFCRHSTDSQK